MCYRAYLQQGLAFAFAFAFVQQSVLEGGSPHTMVRSERAAGGAELDGGRRRRGQAYRSIERLLLHPGLLDAGMDLDLRDLHGGRRRWRSSGGSSRSRPGGSAVPAFIFLELAWRICIKERECVFLHCFSPRLQICIAISNATWSPNQLRTVPAGYHFCLCLALLD
jgi:hypothetical protein